MLKRVINRILGKFPYVVQNFTYNGFCGRDLPGMTDYHARFKKWTNDPGVAIFRCSDGKDRLIPTFALRGLKEHRLPRQDMRNKVMLGTPCKSISIGLKQKGKE